MASPDTAVTAIVLAAGASRRMGSQKLLLPLGGRSLLARVLDAVEASPVNETVVVAGWSREGLLPILCARAVRVVLNERWAEGQSSSVRAGVAAVSADAGAALFCTADQPWLTSSLVARIVERWRATGARIVAPAFGERRGGPVLFSRELFPELAALRGDSGGRQVLVAHLAEVETVPVDDPRLLEDIDTEADYRRALAQIDTEDNPS